MNPVRRAWLIMRHLERDASFCARAGRFGLAEEGFVLAREWRRLLGIEGGMMGRSEKPTMPPPPREVTRRDILARVDELRAEAQRILATAGDLVLIAERMPGGSVR
jgi:hypothetical protein